MLRLKKLTKTAVIPEYQSDEAAGMDLHAAHGIVLEPGEIQVIPTGLEIELERGYEGQVRSRSGLSCKGIVVMNAPGTIDSDYRGEIKIILGNLSKEPYSVKIGARIAQLVIAPVVQATIQEVTSLTETVRGSGGFGSTGN